MAEIIGGIMCIGTVVIVVGGIWWLTRKYGTTLATKKHDEKIETAMRLGVRDAGEQLRVARKILDEQEDKKDRE